MKKVARLARLDITADEEKLYQEQLQSIVQHFQQLDEVNTDGVEVFVSPVENPGALRKDEVRNELNQEAALNAAPELMGRLFRVPPVV